MRTYLGPKNPDYQVLRSNLKWPDHRLRTLATGAVIRWVEPSSALDPACGDGSILAEVLHHRPGMSVMVSDISQKNVEHAVSILPGSVGWVLPIEQAITNDADVVVLTEILEHLEDPDAILRLARQHHNALVASSPVMRPGQHDRNPEHLWQFDREGYEEMLRRAGWETTQYTFLEFRSEYDFGIWACRPRD